MINAWSLLYEELNGTMAKTYPIKDDDMSPCKLDDPIFTVGSGNTASADTTTYHVDTTQMGDISIDTSALDNEHITISGGDTVVNFDDIIFNDTGYADTWPHAETLNIDTSGYPSAFTALSDNDDAISNLIDKPISSGIEDTSNRKYKEDESIEALKNYISTTYGGHYTSDNNSVQTLDRIESVGDAEACCRSNAIKYLSRYDKKGQAKRDILKALHYSLLLYHFSGQLNETPTRGYETF